MNKEIEIKIPHLKNNIYGFGFHRTIFWWFDNRTIVYHIDKGKRTHYLKLPDEIESDNYIIVGFLEEKNSLLLTK